MKGSLTDLEQPRLGSMIFSEPKVSGDSRAQCGLESERVDDRRKEKPSCLTGTCQAEDGWTPG